MQVVLCGDVNRSKTQTDSALILDKDYPDGFTD